MHKKHLLTTAILASLAALTQNAVAQNKPAAPAASAQGLEEIIITAERRNQSLQSAPLAVTAVSGEELAERGVTSANEITKLVPAVTFGEGGGGITQLFIRGIGGVASNSLAESLVAFNMDGTYLSRNGSINGSFFDLDRIEIVKGPQGTLYGRNATAGAANIITNKPKLDRFGGNVTATLGNYNQKKIEAVVNAPLSSSAALRIALQSVDRKGYLSDGFNDEKHWSARASLLVKPSDTLSILVTADKAHISGRGGASVVAPLANPSNPWLGPSSPELASYWTTPNFLLALPPALGGPRKVQAQFQPETKGLPIGRLNNDNSSVYGSLDWDVAEGKLTVIPSTRKSTLDYTQYAVGFPVIGVESDKNKSLEVRFASSDQSPLRGVVGVYYFGEDGSYTTLAGSTNALGAAPTFATPAAAPALTAYTRTQVDNTNTKANAAFGQATYDISSTVHLIAGVRASDEKKSVTGSIFGTTTLPAIPFGGNISAKKTTWKAGLNVDLAPASMIYATVGTGFKAGGFFPAIASATTTNIFRPETITAWTLGSKNRLLDNSLQFNVEAFYWDYKDKQVSHLANITNPNNAPTFLSPGLVTENAGNAKFYGLEFDLRYRVSSYDTVASTIQYEHSNYASYVYTQPGTAVPITGCNGTVLAGVVTIDCSGKPVPFVPSMSINLNYSHVTPLAGGADMVFSVAGRYKSGHWISDSYANGNYQNAATKADLSATYHASGDSWSVMAYVDNVTNKATLTLGSLNTFNASALAGIEAPRTVGVRAGFKY